ncbi:hypothetical protein BGS_0929 [Beggiatoa sp. SS]|nr:hypothetical protein BGS_0929 [Beggiatoa sp. SS]
MLDGFKTTCLLGGKIMGGPMGKPPCWRNFSFFWEKNTPTCLPIPRAPGDVVGFFNTVSFLQIKHTLGSHDPGGR